MCRVCGRYAANKRSLRIFENQGILWNLQVLTGIFLENAEFLPDLICICCQTELREAIRFRERVIGAQHELLEGLTDEQLKQIPLEYREAIMELADNTSQKATNTSNSETESESTARNVQGERVNFIIEQQPKDVEIFEDDHSKQEDLLEYDIIIDEGLIKHESEAQAGRDIEAVQDPNVEHQLTVVEEATENGTSVDYTSILPDKESDEECAMLDRVLNDEIAVAQTSIKKKPGRKRHGSLIFICDECGNHISGRMAFDLHCRRHRGDKQFECDICRDRFCTSSELKRHMRRHTGERPFACQYCERSFTDYSTRVKHERTHTNERPYVCQSCGKAFTTAYILKNHMLIHSGERAFSCELCNKSFIRQTHLVTHCRSSAHKRNEERENQELQR
ncbi:hypothetical protein ACLKA7_007951 [Drosophila subpalustris]